MKLTALVFLVWSGVACSAQTAVFQALISRPATSRPPAKLFIGKQVFEVGMLEPGYMAGNDGVTMCSKKLILINVATTENTMRKAFMHEALHAMFCDDSYRPHWWTKNRERRHKDIYYLGPTLAQVLEENPYLTNWLASAGTQ